MATMNFDDFLRWTPSKDSTDKSFTQSSNLPNSVKKNLTSLLSDVTDLSIAAVDEKEPSRRKSLRQMAHFRKNDVIPSSITKAKQLVKSAITTKQRRLVNNSVIRFSKRIQTIDITPLPDKPPGIIRMPQSPTLSVAISSLEASAPSCESSLGSVANSSCFAPLQTESLRASKRRRVASKLETQLVCTTEAESASSERDCLVQAVEQASADGSVAAAISSRTRRRSAILAMDKIAKCYLSPSSLTLSCSSSIVSAASNSCSSGKAVKLFSIFEPKKSELPLSNCVNDESVEEKCVEQRKRTCKNNDVAVITLADEDDDAAFLSVSRTSLAVVPKTSSGGFAKSVCYEHWPCPRGGVGHTAAAFTEASKGCITWIKPEKVGVDLIAALTSADALSFKLLRKFLSDAESTYVSEPADMDALSSQPTHRGTCVSASTDNGDQKSIERESVLLTDKWKPLCFKDHICSSQRSAKDFWKWLQDCKLRLRSCRTVLPPSECKRSKRSRKSSSGDSSDDAGSVTNIALISGPTGCGKTSLVYACASQLYFNVLELNASSCRSSSNMLSAIRGALKSHLVSRTAPGKASVANFFQTSKVKAPLLDDLVQVDANQLDCNEFSLVLIDEADVVFADDENFWAGVKAIADESHIPLILTSSADICDESQMYFVNNSAWLRLHPSDGLRLETFKLENTQSKQLASHVDSLLQRDLLQTGLGASHSHHHDKGEAANDNGSPLVHTNIRQLLLCLHFHGTSACLFGQSNVRDSKPSTAHCLDDFSHLLTQVEFSAVRDLLRPSKFSAMCSEPPTCRVSPGLQDAKPCLFFVKSDFNECDRLFQSVIDDVAFASVPEQSNTACWHLLEAIVSSLILNDNSLSAAEGGTCACASIDPTNVLSLDYRSALKLIQRAEAFKEAQKRRSRRKCDYVDQLVSFADGGLRLKRLLAADNLATRRGELTTTARASFPLEL